MKVDFFSDEAAEAIGADRVGLGYVKVAKVDGGWRCYRSMTDFQIEQNGAGEKVVRLSELKVYKGRPAIILNEHRGWVHCDTEEQKAYLIGRYGDVELERLDVNVYELEHFKIPALAERTRELDGAADWFCKTFGAD